MLEDPFIAGDALYVELEGKPERAPRDVFINMYDPPHENDSNKTDEFDNGYDDPNPNYSDDKVKKKKYEDHDWLEDRNNLNNIIDWEK